MKSSRRAAPLLAFLLCHVAVAQPATAPAPAFEVAYRAWDIATDIARHNGNADISGDCGKTFRPFVIPGLRRQTRPEQDQAATACLAAARSVCSNPKLERTAEMEKKCGEFR